MANQTQQLLDHFFRNEYGKLVSLLTHKFSYQHIDIIEDAVQEAMLKATRLWPYGEIPDNPFGWLYRVANNYTIDRLRHVQKVDGDDRIPESLAYADYHSNYDNLDEALSDELLTMFFACCHPDIVTRDRLMISLKILCGFSITEIASALMLREQAVKKALTRAKQKFKSNINLKHPTRQQINDRLPDVLTILYLMFNEGYKSTDGDQLMKKDICDDAIRLAQVILNSACNDKITVHALLSLMFFKAARFEARIDEAGKLVTLKHQDRNQWNDVHIRQGFKHLALSQGQKLTTYHLEAGIEGYYCSAPSYDETDWENILYLYDLLLKIDHSYPAALNRVVVLEHVKGAKSAYEELKKLADHSRIPHSYIYYVIKADLEEKTGNLAAAREALELALKTTSNLVEQRFIKDKLGQMGFSNE